MGIITIIPLISLILYSFILMIILTSNKTKLSKAFSLYIIAMIVWSIGSFLMKTKIPPSSEFWNRILLVGLISVPVFLLRFSYIMTESYHKMKIIKFGYISSIILIISGFLNFVTYDVQWVDGVFTYKLGYGSYIMAIIGSSFYVLALANIIIQVKRNEIPLKRVRFVIVGLSLVIIGALLNFNTFIGQFGVDIVLNLVNALLITYSIYRNKFLEINLVVKRGLSFSLYNIILYLIYVVVVLFSYEVMTRMEVFNLTTFIIIISPVFILMEPLRRLIQRWTNHLFYRQTTDRQMILKEFSKLVSTELNLDYITESLVGAIGSAVDTRRVTILLKNAVKYKFCTSNFAVNNEDDLFIMFDHPIVSWFKDKHDILILNDLSTQPIFKGLWDKEKAVIKELETELMLPIRYLDNIIGLVVVSGRNDETPYSEDEIDFLKTIINNAAAIIENAKTYEIVKRQSITDELTKLYSHRYFYEIARNWIDNNVFDKFSLAMVDVDQFKVYNDLYGHSSGDIALKRIAEILTDNTGDNDVLVRYGGEEFIILIPNIDGKDSLNAIEKVRRAIEDKFLLSKDIKEFLTVSVGVSNYPAHSEKLEELIEFADKAMYKGKQSGRNKAILYTEESLIEDSSHNQVQKAMKEAYLSSIYALAATIDAKDHYTFGHSNNVATLAKELASKAGFSVKDIETVYNAGLLHDIGKVGIPETILSKPGRLTKYEKELMDSHVTYSINIIKHIPNLLDTVPAIMSHHEKYDGSGYPRGIKGDNIPILGRCICICDSFDAMTTDRPYKKGKTFEEARDELRKYSGIQFDPVLVEVFIDLINDGLIDTLPLENRLTIQ